MYNVIWANQKTESFEYHWLRALAMLDVPPFRQASDIISSSVDMLVYTTWSRALSENFGCYVGQFVLPTIWQVLQFSEKTSFSKN